MAGNWFRKPGWSQGQGFDSSTLRSGKVARVVRGRLAKPRSGLGPRGFDPHTFRSLATSVAHPSVSHEGAVEGSSGESRHAEDKRATRRVVADRLHHQRREHGSISEIDLTQLVAMDIASAAEEPFELEKGRTYT